MMSKASLMMGALTGLTLLMASSAAVAQLHDGYEQQSEAENAYPDDQHPSTQDEQDDHHSPEDAAQPPRADDDFSDLAARNQGEAPARANDPEVDAVIDSCAIAARDEAEREGGYADVRQVQEPRETRQGYTVDGEVEVRSSWRGQDGQTRHFTCSVENGRIADIYFHRERANR